MNLLLRRMVVAGLLPILLLARSSTGWAFSPPAGADALPGLKSTMLLEEAFPARLLFLHNGAIRLFFTVTAPVRGLLRGFGEIGGLTRIGDKDARIELEAAILQGQAVAIDPTWHTDFYFSVDMPPDVQAQMLLAGFNKPNPYAQEVLTDYLASAENVRRLRAAIDTLRRTLAAAGADRTVLESRRFVLVLPEHPFVTGGMITAFQTGSWRGRKTIFMGVEVIEFSEEAKAPKNGLLATIRHENHHLERNPRPDYRPPTEPRHSSASRMEFELTEAFRLAFTAHQRRRLSEPVSGLSWRQVLRRATALGFLGISQVSLELILPHMIVPAITASLGGAGTNNRVMRLSRALSSIIDPRIFDAGHFGMGVRFGQDAAEQLVYADIIMGSPTGEGPITEEVHIEMEGMIELPPVPFYAEHPQTDTADRQRLIERFQNLPVFLPAPLSVGVRGQLMELLAIIPHSTPAGKALRQAIDHFEALEILAQSKILTMAQARRVMGDLNAVLRLLSEVSGASAEHFAGELLEHIELLESNGTRGSLRRQLEQAGKVFHDHPPDLNMEAVIRDFLNNLDRLGISARYKRVADATALDRLARLRTLADAIRQLDILCQRWDVQMPVRRMMANPNDGTEHVILGILDQQGRVFGLTRHPSIYENIRKPGESFSLYNPPPDMGPVTWIMVDKKAFRPSLDEVREVPRPSLEPLRVKFLSEEGAAPTEATIGSPEYMDFRDRLRSALLIARFGDETDGIRVMKHLQTSAGKATAIFGPIMSVELGLQGHNVISVDANLERQQKFRQQYFRIRDLTEAEKGQMLFIDDDPDKTRLGRYLSAVDVELLVSMSDELRPQALAELIGTPRPIKLYLGPQSIGWDEYTRQLEDAGWHVNESIEVPAPRQEGSPGAGHFFSLVPLPGGFRRLTTPPPASAAGRRPPSSVSREGQLGIPHGRVMRRLLEKSA